MNCSRWMAVLLAACGWTGAARGAAAGAARPNIVFLLTDDQVDRSVGCYGNGQVRTPNMDRLAREGVLFRNHYNTTSICMASRATIMTGLYEYRTGCNFAHGDLKPATFLRSYPVLLREAGYFTGFAGKIGFTLDGRPFEEFATHFDAWAGGPGQTFYETAKNKGIAQYAGRYPHSSRAYGAWAGDAVRAAKAAGKPFCLSVSFKAPHLPFTPDPAFDAVYAGTVWRTPGNYGVEHAAHLAPQSKTGRQFKSYRFWVESEASYQEAMRAYNQLIHGVDAALGMIREALDAEGVAGNTVIILTSDNGYSCGAHGFGGKVLPYEEASRSPLILYDPRRPAAQRGQERDAVTGNIDLAPTMLDLAGLPLPAGIDGRSLVPLLDAPGDPGREALALMNLWGNDEIQELAVVTRDWKYIYWPYRSDAMRPTEELFHLAEDRLEMRNVAGDPEHAAQLETMRALYDRQVRHLKEHAVDYNGYAKYGTLFERRAPENATPENREKTGRAGKASGR